MTTTGSRSLRKRAGWIGPIIAAVVIIACVWWGYTAVHGVLSARVASRLLAEVDFQAELLHAWRDEHGDAETPIAEIAAKLPSQRTLETGEVLVFDKNGVLLVAPRFDAEAKALGLPVPVDLRDPGGDLTAGFKPDVARRAMPFTKAAGGATAGNDGHDLEGYRSYRGVEVVGAWRWLPDLGVGVAAEIAVHEVYAPTRVLRKALWTLILLSIIGGAVGVVVERRSSVLLSKVRQAEKKARRLGQYTLVKKIGEGGMGEVYVARHAMMRRPTAIKLLRADRTNESALLRFEREVQQTTRLTHPNTVQIFDFGRTPGGTFYYAMEYLVGIPLDEFVASEGPLEEGRVIYILQQVCASLNEAHGLGLVHRDIKPENIILCRAGGAYDVAKVLDFGLVMDSAADASVNLSVDGAILGTPLYMSPEAFLRPKEVDGRSDLYSLGAVGYFLLTGRPPFEGETVIDLFNQQTKVKPVPPSECTDNPILPDVEKAILACLEKNPVHRPKTANALSRELEWCRSFGEWNRDKARYWWQENEKRMDELFGLSSKAQMTPSSGAHATIEIRLDDR